MLIFKSSDPDARYVAKTLHSSLGIEFIDKVELTFIVNSLEPLDSSVVFKDEKNLIKGMLIKTPIFNLILNSFSLKSEENLSRDKLERVVLDEGCSEVALPFIDQEVARIRVILLSQLEEHEVNFSINTFLSSPTVCLTHDVDSIKSNSILRFFYQLSKLMIKFKFREVFQFVTDFNFLYNSHGDFINFISLERKYNFVSTYYFLSLPFFLGIEGRRYSVNSTWIKKAIRMLSDQGFEVGLHMSRKGYKNKIFGMKEKKRLQRVMGVGSEIKGVRNHYLSGFFPDVWLNYENNFEYDSSLGSSLSISYRSGTSNPFIPYDHKSQKDISIIEFPFVIMDGALTGTAEEIYNEVKRHIDIAYKNKSLINILWHTDRILEGNFNEHSLAYNKILKYLAELSFHSITASQISDQYKGYVSKMINNICLSH